jgi:uncharacterized protein YbjT (DUF2867 family)
MILLTGATGNTGAVIADRLAERGVPFVALVRSDANRDKLAARGIASVHGDFDDPASLGPALQGVERAYLVSTPDETLVRRESAFIEACAAAGVKRVVKCSAYLSDLDSDSPNLRSHALIEKALAESGMEWTSIRPHGYMQTFTLFSWDMIRKAGVVSMPHGDGAMPLVDVRDVAEVAVKALVEDGHSGRIYDVTGPEALTMWDMAETLEKVLGKPITYIDGDVKTVDRVMKILGVPQTPRDHVMVIANLVRAHKLDTVHSTLADLGIRPTTYEEFLRDLVAGRTGGGNSFQPPDTLQVRLLTAAMPWMMRARLLFGRPKRPEGLARP